MAAKISVYQRSSAVSNGQGCERLQKKKLRPATFLLGLFALWLGPAFGPIAVARAADQPATSFKGAPTGEQIAQWVKDLDSDQFAQRQGATDNLILAGQLAIAPVVAVIPGSNREVATRGIHVLRGLALGGNVPTQDAAEKALRTLAAASSKSVARLATAAIASVGEGRQKQAVRHLVKWGAKISSFPVPVFGANRSAHVSVEIGAAWHGSLDDLQRLKWLQDVRQITFDGKRFSGPWIQPIKYMKNLQVLTIRHANITDDSLRVVRDLKSIVAVYLLYTPVTDASLEHLKGLKSLRDVRIYGTRITKDAAKRFQAVATNVRVDHKNGAFLGVQCRQPPDACEVLTVTPESAAQKAGVKANDIIIRYRGKPTADFDDLKVLIADDKVGDTVVIHVARGGTRMEAALPRQKELDLGIDGTTTPYGCKVNKVAGGSAAAKISLRPGDVIRAFNGERISSLADLQKAYASDSAKQRAAILVYRDVKVVTLRVTFGEWQSISLR